MSFDTLSRKILDLKNPTVVGLDPLPSLIPPDLFAEARTRAAAYLEYNRALIDALCDIVPAVKPQAAYYEYLGPRG
ncbi:MAG: orotidine 5'-phosphate decarboxylase, partial [Oscillospiraceae bacterium]|nr:orotidine 5'-phosphate decarboxylase [Oscillospiraceae bacterium]